MRNFSSFLELNELAYEGNIGIMELHAFYTKATPEQTRKLKELIAKKQNKEAFELLRQVTGVKLRESNEVVGRRVTDQELVKILGKAKTKSLITNPFFRDYSNYQKAYKYGVDKIGFPWVEVYFYFDEVHRKADGTIRPEIMAKFIFSYSGSKLINAHKYTRSKEPNDNEKRWGPTAGWNHLSNWKEIKE